MDYVRTYRRDRLTDTYIFRGNNTWKYKHIRRRPADRYPKEINRDWPGVPDNLNAYVHYSEYNQATSSYIDDYFFFKGTQNKSLLFYFRTKENLIF